MRQRRGSSRSRTRSLGRCRRPDPILVGALNEVHERRRYPVLGLRPGSATFGKWSWALLSEENKRQLFVPQGFAHGFCVLSQSAHVAYKCSDYYNPEDEGGLLWSDPDIAIDWPLKDPILSAKDRQFGYLADQKFY